MKIQIDTTDKIIEFGLDGNSKEATTIMESFFLNKTWNGYTIRKEQKDENKSKSSIEHTDPPIYWKQYRPSITLGEDCADYTDNPRVKTHDDLYYTGWGRKWDTDLDGKRYWKRYHPVITIGGDYNFLNYGDIIYEKARIMKYIQEYMDKNHLF
jgi:hypothetical protein